MKRTEVEQNILSQSVKNLQTYGYPAVNEENIFLDTIYSAFFERMLKDAIGQGADKEINNLLNEMTDVATLKEKYMPAYEEFKSLSEQEEAAPLSDEQEKRYHYLATTFLLPIMDRLYKVGEEDFFLDYQFKYYTKDKNK